MLELKHVTKDYVSGDETVHALKGIDLQFRESEFVAILGQSGCGKTTLLNIIGGLDQYTDGDLVINGTSTKQYKDKDWDAYRNHSVGFVFQSYNLIPHQTVLSNVELALTLSGVSREERRSRAIEALKAVGLGDQLGKKPSQMSGGQMQRVAIARALVNDPDIILADEPTGALDTHTSVQVMDILKEVAKDRLVIMVTHNPELAEQYATRIVRLLDGVVKDDSNPLSADASQIAQAKENYAARIKHTSMSMLTALSLSLNNLMTKKGRTLLTAFAGSIGIIGIAAILSLANGVNGYIKSVEEDTLSEYPLTIDSTGFDMTSMLTMGMVEEDTEDTSTASDADSNSDSDSEGSSSDGQVKELKMMTSMFDSIGSNDLASLKTYLDSGESGIEQYVNTIEYGYDVTPQIYLDGESGVRQVNPDQSFAQLGLGSTNSSNSLMSMTMSTDVFYELPRDTTQVEGQYDVVAGHWPENYDECVVVLTSGGGLSDFMFYSLGLRDGEELDDMVAQFANNEDVTIPEHSEVVTYDDLTDVRFKLVDSTDYYVHDDEYGVWTDKSSDEAYVKELVENGEELKVVGVVMPNEDSSTASLTPGIYYPASLSDHVVEKAKDTEIVKEQLADPSKNVFTGKSFAEEEESEDSESGFDMNSLFTIDENAVQAAFKFDESALAVDISQYLDFSGLSSAIQIPQDASSMDLSGLESAMTPQVDTSAVASSMSSMIEGYMAYLQTVQPGETPLSPDEYFAQPDIQAQIGAALAGAIDTSGMQAQVAAAVQSAMESYMQTTMASLSAQIQQAVSTQVGTAFQAAMNQMASNMAGAMSVDTEAFQNAFQMNMDEQQLSELMMSLMSTEAASFDGNLKKLGYADYDKPDSIDIYPIDFESKEKVKEILDDYNRQMEESGETGKVITYTDLVGALMTSVTDIVNMISYVLVAFVAISLVVSSIMIGVITYISVLERNKEIGILRAIGASKGDIARVFNAETLIVGFVAGALGIGLTALICIPVNAIVYSLFDVPNVAALPPAAAAVLVCISMLLTFLAGLIPSSVASRKDPVVALRSE